MAWCPPSNLCKSEGITGQPKPLTLFRSGSEDREPDRRLPAPGSFRRHQFRDADLPPGPRHLRCFAFRRRSVVARWRVIELLGAEPLVHALPDTQRRLVAEAFRCEPDGVTAAVHLAAILSRRRCLRARLWRSRNQRRQRSCRLPRTALRPEAQFPLLDRLSALRLR